MAQFSPDDIANQRFRSAFRGFDPSAVAEYLGTVAQSVAELVVERDRLQARLAEMGERDLKREFEAVGREVAQVLESAREAADQMRERASADATRWRSEAIAEAEAALRRARADAEQLRSDAWSTGEELLKQAMAESDRIASSTEKERLRMVGESERESHRLVSAARRESEELLRSARMEADRLRTTAQKEHDQIIQQASRTAEAAQERTRALELRREELRAELDEIRHALATAEGELEDRRAALALSPTTPETPTEAPASAEGDEDSTEWTPGETVRVVRPSTPPGPSEPSNIVSHETPEITVLSAEELARRTAEEKAEGADVEIGEPLDVFEPDDEPPEREEESREDESEETPEVETVTVDVTLEAPVDDDDIEVPDRPDEVIVEQAQVDHVQIVDQPAQEVEEAPETDELGESFAELSGLFERLRGPETPPADGGDVEEAEPEPDEPEPSVEPEPAASTDRAPVDYDGDPFELKSGLLMPIANRALRNIKRQLTEAQNEALEELRLTDGAWDPDRSALAARLRPDLTVLASESFAAGHAASVEMSGERLKRPPTPKMEPETEWVSSLIRDLNHTLAEGRRQGQGSRELGASVSRVFRSWRTDEAERRVAEVSSHAYHTALTDVLIDSGFSVSWLVAGRGCPTCRTNAESVPSEWTSVPPAHSGCGCTLVIV